MSLSEYAKINFLKALAEDFVHYSILLLMNMEYIILGEDIEAGLKFTDPSVCKSFLMGLCPFEQFHNTVTKVIICFFKLKC